MTIQAASSDRRRARTILVALFVFPVVVLAIAEARTLMGARTAWGLLARTGVALGLLVTTFYAAKHGFGGHPGRAAVAGAALVAVVLATVFLLPEAPGLLGRVAELLVEGLVIGLVLLLGRKAGWWLVDEGGVRPDLEEG